MRRGNLFDYMQSQNMRCIFIDFLQIQSRKNFRGIAFAVVDYCQVQEFFSYFSFDTDLDRFRIMPHAVAQQVFEKPSEQGTVDRNLRVFGGICLIQRNFAVFCQGTVVELSDQFTEQRSGGESFFSEWLCTIFQFAG